jgi:hypothetical protein
MHFMLYFQSNCDQGAKKKERKKGYRKFETSIATTEGPSV